MLVAGACFVAAYFLNFIISLIRLAIGIVGTMPVHIVSQNFLLAAALSSVVLAYAAFASVGIWRSSQQSASGSIGAILARAAVCLWLAWVTSGIIVTTYASKIWHRYEDWNEEVRLATVNAIYQEARNSNASNSDDTAQLCAKQLIDNWIDARMTAPTADAISSRSRDLLQLCRKKLGEPVEPTAPGSKPNFTGS